MRDACALEYVIPSAPKRRTVRAAQNRRMDATGMGVDGEVRRRETPKELSLANAARDLV